MQDTISRFLSQVPDNLLRRALQPLFETMGRGLSTCVVRGAGLEIAGTTTLAQIGSTSTFVATVNGKLVTIAAGVDMPVLVGTVTNAKFNIFAFFVNDAGTVTSVMGTEGGTLSAVKFPNFPTTPCQACIGFVIINPTGTGNFVGGTTALTDAAVVPNAVYVSPVGAFDPTFLII